VTLIDGQCAIIIDEIPTQLCLHGVISIKKDPSSIATTRIDRDSTTVFIGCHSPKWMRACFWLHKSPHTRKHVQYKSDHWRRTACTVKGNSPMYKLGSKCSFQSKTASRRVNFRESDVCSSFLLWGRRSTKGCCPCPCRSLHFEDHVHGIASAPVFFSRMEATQKYRMDARS